LEPTHGIKNWLFMNFDMFSSTAILIRESAKLGSIIFGQEGQALFNALAIPDWFLGRGRSTRGNFINYTRKRKNALFF
jgi:hypothetical protein